MVLSRRYFGISFWTNIDPYMLIYILITQTQFLSDQKIVVKWLYLHTYEELTQNFLSHLVEYEYYFPVYTLVFFLCGHSSRYANLNLSMHIFCICLETFHIRLFGADDRQVGLLLLASAPEGSM